MNERVSSSVSGKAPLLRRRWFWLGAFLSALFLSVLIILPHVIGFELKRILATNTNERVHIEDVDFNPFTATLALQGVEVRDPGKTVARFDSLSLNLSWPALLRKRLRIQGLVLDGARISVAWSADGTLRVDGLAEFPMDPESAAEAPSKPGWGIGLDRVRITDSEVQYRDADLDLTITVNDLQLGELAEWNTESAATLELDGKLQGASVQFDGTILPYARQPELAGHLHAEAVPVAALRNLIGDSSLSGALGINGNVRWGWGDTMTVQQQGELSLGSLRASTPVGDVQQERLTWKGELALSLPASPDWELDAEGTLSSEKLQLRKGTAIQWEQGSIRWQGELTRGAAGVGLRGDLEARDFSLQLEAERRRSMRFAQLQAKDIAGETAGEIGIANLTLSGMKVATEMAAGKSPDAAAEDGFLEVKTQRLEKIRFSARKGLRIARFQQDNVRSTAIRDADGEWNMVRFVDVLVNATDELTDSGAQEKKPRGKGSPLRIDRLEVTGESTLMLQDRAVSPPYELVFHVRKMEVDDIDSSQPELDSPVRIEGRVGEYADLELNGTLQVFAKGQNANLKGRIDDLSLPPLSSYLAGSIGYNIESGEMDADLELKITAGELDGTSRFVIHQLRVSRVEDAETSIDKELGVPLEAALKMLRDKQNTITLTVPISGNLEDPKFDPGDAINQAVSKAVKAGALTFLTSALQPYGSLITLARIAGEEVMKVRLDPIEFAPGRDQLSEAAAKYLGHVAGVLEDRPEIHLSVCGVAVEQDRTVLAGNDSGQSATATEGKQGTARSSVSDAALLALAKRRRSVVKRHLVEQYNIDDGRLVSCRSSIDAEKPDATPRTDLLI